MGFDWGFRWAQLDGLRRVLWVWRFGARLWVFPGGGFGVFVEHNITRRTRSVWEGLVGFGGLGLPLPHPQSLRFLLASIRLRWTVIGDRKFEKASPKNITGSTKRRVVDGHTNTKL